MTATPSRSPSASGRLDRRTIWLSALILAVAIVGGVAVVAGLSDTEARERPTTEEGLPEAEMIPQPNEGKAPKDSGDRGGWAQLALFGLLVVAIAGIGAVVLRGNAKARRNRAAWRAAAATGVDGVVGDRLGPAHPQPSGTSEASGASGTSTASAAPASPSPSGRVAAPSGPAPTADLHPTAPAGPAGPTSPATPPDGR